MEISINLDGRGELQALWKRAPEIARDEVLSAIKEIDQELIRELMELNSVTPSANGTLRRSMRNEESVGEFGVVGLVGSSLSYAEPVELGTRPHFPPVEALEDWVRVKIGLTDDKEVRSRAFHIARKISRVGTKGAFMFKKTMARLEPFFDARMAQARDRIVARLSGR
jgi:hypothetical protein